MFPEQVSRTDLIEGIAEGFRRYLNDHRYSEGYWTPVSGKAIQRAIDEGVAAAMKTAITPEMIRKAIQNNC